MKGLILRSIFEPILADLGSVFGPQIRPCWPQTPDKIKSKSSRDPSSCRHRCPGPFSGRFSGPKTPQDLPRPTQNLSRTPQRAPQDPVLRAQIDEIKPKMGPEIDIVFHPIFDQLWVAKLLKEPRIDLKIGPKDITS